MTESKDLPKSESKAYALGVLDTGFDTKNLEKILSEDGKQIVKIEPEEGLSD